LFTIIGLGKSPTDESDDVFVICPASAGSATPARLGVMNWEELGQQLETIALSEDREHRLAEYRRLLADLAPGQEGRAEVLTCLADDLKWDGDLDQGVELYQQAIDDGGRTVLSPHAGLLDIALERGEDDRADELLAVLLDRSRADALVVGDYEWIGEALEAAGRLRAALRWFTIPLRDIQPGDIDLMPEVCLHGRWRVRRALDLPIDAYDESYEVLQEVTAESPVTP
jgi:tetratricopeptide (TPR) repeat protein